MDSYFLLMQKLHPGAVLTFREYTLDRRENRRLACEIKDVIIQMIIQPNQQLSRDDLILYYGDGLSDTDYLQLSSVNCLRVVVITGVNEESNPQYKVIMINRDFYMMGLQEVSIIEGVENNEISYLSEMNKLGFGAQVNNVDEIQRIPIISGGLV